jgi:sugar phosphate isomerase/epimerase
LKAGFRHFELWQYHLTRISDPEFTRLASFVRNQDLHTPIVGAYPEFHLEGEAAEREWTEQQVLLERASRLGAGQIKFFFGRLKAEALQGALWERTQAAFERWYRAGQALGFSFIVETHGNTLLDPLTAGLKLLQSQPAWKLSFCYQPYDFNSTALALEEIDTLKTGIVHAHFQGRNTQNNFCLLSQSAIDYRQVVPALRAVNSELWPSIEFVRRGFPKLGEDLDLNAALEDARQDAAFLHALGLGLD